MHVRIEYLVCNLQDLLRISTGCFKFLFQRVQLSVWGFMKIAFIDCCSFHIHHRCIQHVSCFLRLVTEFHCFSRRRSFINMTCVYNNVGSDTIFTFYQDLRHGVVSSCLASQASSIVQKMRVCFRKFFS